MRAKRAKQYRKLMQKYELHFGFRAPYQVLLDADVVRAASSFKMKLGAMLEGTLGASEIKPMITQCCIRHLYNATAVTEAEKREKDGWIEVAKQAERRRCGHHELETPLSTLECLASVVDGKQNGTNKHRYIVASQDPEVRASMRLIAGVPLIYINRSVMILEPMATRTQEVREAEEKNKLRAGLKRRGDLMAGAKRKREDEDEDAHEAGQGDSTSQLPPQKRRTKGPKGPNPLSVKKSKKETRVSATAAKDVQERPTEVRLTHTIASDTPLKAQGMVDELEVDVLKKRKRKRKPKESSDVTGVRLEDEG